MPARPRKTTTTTATTTTTPRGGKRDRGRDRLSRLATTSYDPAPGVIIRNPIKAKRESLEAVNNSLNQSRDRWMLARARYATTSPMDEEFGEVMRELKAATESYLDHAQKTLRVSERV